MSAKVPQDHDQRFKTLLMEFFREFLYLFFPTWAERFDFATVDWLTQEVFPDPPAGERRALDLVCRLRLKPGVEPPFAGGEEGGLVLIHVEVEAKDRISGFRRRFFEYYYDLRRKSDLPVWPIGLFLRVGLEGVGWTSYEETFWDRRILEFNFTYIGFPALDADAYITGESMLGVALTSLMGVPRERRVELQAEGLDRIVRSGENDWRRFLLAECLQRYSNLEPAEWERLQTLLLTDKYKEAGPMTLTYYDRGQLAAMRRVVLRQLEIKFGSLPATVKARLETLSFDQLDELTVDLMGAESLKELGLEDEAAAPQ